MNDLPTEDRLLGGRVSLAQPAEGYRAALDPVLLAAAVPPLRAGDRALDLGCGAGAAALCLAARQEKAEIAGLELQPGLADLARRNAASNGWAARLHIFTGDILSPPPELEPGSFSAVLANPPFLPEARQKSPRNASRALSHAEGEAGLADWVAAGHRFLRPRGSFCLIHRADRLDEALAAMAGRFGGIETYPLWPRAGQAAKRVILRGRKDARGPAALLPGLVLHEAGGRFTPEADAVLRDGAALPGLA
jgi:tRNA1(Val) A37 N6-methylase TrmN6